MLQVGEWVSKQCCSGEAEVADIDLDVVVLSLVSHYVRVHAHVGPALLAAAAIRVAYALRARALGQSPAGRGVDCSWKMAAVKACIVFVG
jgi:hypothetical protein